jgi:chromosomal replication initiation ATPase DnaA
VNDPLDENELSEWIAQLLRRHRPTMREIIGAVAEFYDLSPELIKSSRRANEVTWARHVICYLARVMTRLSLQSIASRVGRQDHSTIFSAVNRIRRKIVTDDILRDDIDVLRYRIAEKVFHRERMIGEFGAAPTPAHPH